MSTKEVKQRVKELLLKPYVRVLVPEEDGGFSAAIPEFSGCFADGRSAKEAARNLERAAYSWLFAMLEGGKEGLLTEPVVPAIRDCKKLFKRITGKKSTPPAAPDIVE
jgi:predicted RNase H-like HicB family nuclease